MSEYEPLYSDRHKQSFNFTLILALALTVLGFFQGAPQLVAVGVAFAAFAWLTTPKSYTLFQDRLLIAFGKPRMKAILYRDIDEVELVELRGFSPRLRVHYRRGSRTWLVPNDLETFHDRIQDALDTFRERNPEGDIAPE